MHINIEYNHFKCDYQIEKVTFVSNLASNAFDVLMQLVGWQKRHLALQIRILLSLETLHNVDHLRNRLDKT